MTIPTNIGPYRITRLLGEGAFGIVYEAYQPFLDRQVAIKVLHSDLVKGEQGERQFMDEARTIARLRHPNIVTVYEFGSLPDLTYMVMEYLGGKTLQTRMTTDKLSQEEIIAMLEQIAQAVDYAHKQNIIHRDLKPANIIFTSANQPVIVDFGLAKLMELTNPQLDAKSIRDTMMLGSPGYMAPEQVLGESITPAADQYALATIAYELFTGKLPYEANDIIDMLHKRCTQPPTPLRKQAPEYSVEVEQVLQRALVLEPSARFGSAGEFVNHLGSALLPDYHKSETVIIYDPIQAAQLRAARQMLKGFLWGIVAVAFVVMLFCGVLFLRGFTDGSKEFVWDGIIVRTRQTDNTYMITGVWPGSVAERAGYRSGDIIEDDIQQDYKSGTHFSVNGQPRAALPVYWQPHAGDIIQRTVQRGDQKLELGYTLEVSPYLVIALLVHVIPAAIAMMAAISFLWRWSNEPALPIALLLMVSASFALIASVMSYLIPFIDMVSLFILLPAFLHFILSFPTRIDLVEKHPRLLWWLYWPLPIALTEFVLGHSLIRLPIGDVLVPLLFIYVAMILLAIIFKWLRHDVRRYKGMWWLIIGFIVAVGSAIIPTFAFALNAQGVIAMFGNGVNQIVFGYFMPILMASISVLCNAIGYHKVQAVLGPTLILSESGGRHSPVSELAANTPTSTAI